MNTFQNGNSSEAYACLWCGRELPVDGGVVVHDEVPHPEDATFDEDDHPQ